MINSVQLKNFGPITELDWQNLGPINLVIGNNGCGKSFLLKAMYSAVRTLEDYKRGDNPDRLDHILINKLFWTFQPEGIGNLVSESSHADLSFSLTLNQKTFRYSFPKKFINAFNNWKNEVPPRTDNSVFLPAKEVLSLHHIILESREQDKVFGFDDTYLDLAKALQIPLKKRMFAIDLSQYDKEYKSPLPAQGYDSKDFRKSRDLLEAMIGGKIGYDTSANHWYFTKNHQRYSIGITAEGIKKIAILDTLLGNGYLNENSIIFIDEPESALHPEAISKFLDIIAILAKHGIQFFLASHSYFVIKKLFLIAQEQKLSIPVLSKEGDNWLQSDLLKDMPDNPIIDESIRLYKEEVNLPS
ncbi:MAG: AAA family ATPase [Methylomicrobium sp.]|jgi:AAA15 family ATPase/GTPase